MLGFFTVVLMGLIAYAYLVEGLFTAFVMCCNVVGAGLIAFNFWEPLANVLEPLFGGSGYEDALSLVLIFSLALATLRTITNNLANTEIEFPPQLQRPGGALFGLLTGYLISGFLVCVLQTLPWHEQFMYFETKVDPGTQTFRRFLPPDRVWLAMMHRAGSGAFSTGGPTFDPDGNFAFRYARHRRYADDRERMPHNGEFDPSRPQATAPALSAPSLPSAP